MKPILNFPPFTGHCRQLALLIAGCWLTHTPAVLAGEPQEESDVKFALYSSAWGENTDDGIRVVAFNQLGHPITLDSLVLLPEQEDGEPQTLRLDLTVPAGGYADTELDYVDLLSGDDCISRTMEENWRLVEISNYTLNPSVRNLIIEDTESFRIYQCIRSIVTSFRDLETDEAIQYEEWVLFHFETRRN